MQYTRRRPVYITQSHWECVLCYAYYDAFRPFNINDSVITLTWSSVVNEQFVFADSSALAHGDRRSLAFVMLISLRVERGEPTAPLKRNQ